jgi:osmotically inducible protein OsmC
VVAPGLDKDEFDKLAADAKATCPISRLLSPGAEITLKATLA